MSTAAIPLDGTGTSPRGGLFHRLYYGQTKFDFVRKRRWWFSASAIVILAGVVSLGARGLNFSIEFVGGTSWQVLAPTTSVTAAENVLRPLGLGGATVTLLGSGKNQVLDVEAKLGHAATGTISNAEANKIATALATLTHKSVNDVSIQQVGPTWGSQISHKAVIALIVFLIVIATYISLFFEWKMALAALIAVAHDIIVTVGIYSLTGFLVTPDTVVAFLTILGYSLYDTIVVFDRVRDNTRGLGATGKLTFTDVVNLSMNQTLARSINTSFVAILPILAVLVLGAEILGATTLQYFGLALLIGLTSGAYSSIFIASPLVAMMKEHEPRYRQIRERLESRGTALQLLSPSAVAEGALTTADQTGGQRRKGARQATGTAPGRLRPGQGRGAAAPVAIDEDVDLDEDVEEMTGSDGRAPRSPAAAGTAPTGARQPGPARQQAGARPHPAVKRPPPRKRKKGKRR